MPGKVYLIGMGPGDPELITIKAIKAIEKCDVLVYDRLVNKQLLQYNKKAELIYVGKTSGDHIKTQDEINDIMVQYAKQGHIVGRLKGGDPFVFGRGGEEALYLREREIPYEIVAGITSAIAVPQYAGIPVTFRKIATSFHVITGHEENENASENDSQIDWAALAKVKGTLIFLMGLENMDKIIHELVRHGKSLECPAAVIMNGTRENQKEAFGTLSDIKEKCEAEKIKSPAIIVIGEVVSLHEGINWKKGPLDGLRVVSTRPEDKSLELIERLRALGARVFNLPCIHIRGIEHVVLDKGQIGADHILFFSSYGVKYFMEALKNNRLDSRHIKGKLFGVGPSVQKELEKHGLFDCIVPAAYDSNALWETVHQIAKPGESLLVVRGNLGNEKLADWTSDYEIRQMVVYETHEGCLETLTEEADILLFTSPSCVRGFLKKHTLEQYSQKQVICIGESTSDQAAAAGFNNVMTASDASVDGMIQTIQSWRLENA